MAASCREVRNECQAADICLRLDHVTAAGAARQQHGHVSAAEALQGTVIHSEQEEMLTAGTALAHTSDRP